MITLTYRELSQLKTNFSRIISKNTSVDYLQCLCFEVFSGGWIIRATNLNETLVYKNGKTDETGIHYQSLK